MKQQLSVIIAALLSACTLQSQTISDSVLISRLSSNRSNFVEWDHGESLRKRVIATGKDLSANPIVMETSAICDRCPNSDPTNHPELKRATLASDLVVAGHVVRNISALTKNEAFIFTDSEFIIDEVWKSGSESASPQAVAGAEITIAWPGGRVALNGHQISAYPSNRTALEVGHRYLLYLKYLSNSQSYMATSLDGFDISKPIVAPLRKTLIGFDQELLGDRAVFLQAAQASTDRAKEEQSKR